MMKYLPLTLLIAASAWAADGGHGAAAGHADPHAIPWGSIGVQAFNFFLLVGLLVFMLRKTVKLHFEHRARDYKELVERAEVARKTAEAGHREIRERLT